MGIDKNLAGIVPGIRAADKKYQVAWRVRRKNGESGLKCVYPYIELTVSETNGVILLERN